MFPRMAVNQKQEIMQTLMNTFRLLSLSPRGSKKENSNIGKPSSEDSKETQATKGSEITESTSEDTTRPKMYGKTERELDDFDVEWSEVIDLYVVSETELEGPDNYLSFTQKRFNIKRLFHMKTAFLKRNRTNP